MQTVVIDLTTNHTNKSINAGKELSMHVCVAQAPVGKINSVIWVPLSLRPIDDTTISRERFGTNFLERCSKNRRKD